MAGERNDQRQRSPDRSLLCPYTRARALCAARLRGSDWDGGSAHGLTLMKPDVAGGRAPALSEVRVRDQGTGSLQQVAGLLHSPTVPNGTNLAELLCSLPEHDQLFLIGEKEHRPLQVHDATMSQSSSSQPSATAIAHIGPLPKHLERRGKTDSGHIKMLPPSVEEVEGWLKPYPRLQQGGRPASVGHVNPINLDDPSMGYGLYVSWQLPAPIPWGSREWAHQVVDVVTSEYAGVGLSGLALPSIAGNAAALHPFIAWWITLYACSMLARYHARSWVALLDIDTSPLAVPLASVLDIAQKTLPQALLVELAKPEPS